jgi:hypothetical protein
LLKKYSTIYYKFENLSERGRNMKRGISIGFVFWAFIALLLATNSNAAGNNTLTFSETYSEKLLCYKSSGYCDVVGSGKFTVSSKILLSEIDIAQFNSDTPISIMVGDFFFDATLGDGGFVPPYKKGKANFVVSDEDMDGITRKYLTVTLSWNKTSMSVKVTCTTAPWYIQNPIIAGYYMGEPSSGISEPLEAEIYIDDLSIGFDLTANGSVKTKTTDKKALGEYDTSSISVKASGIGTVL